MRSVTAAARRVWALAVVLILLDLLHGMPARGGEAVTPAARRQAIFLLRGSDDAGATAPLLAATGDVDSSVRAEAALGLGWIDSAAGRDALLALLHDPEADVRAAAAAALGRLREERAVPALIAILKAKDTAQPAAADALSRIGGPSVTPVMMLLHTDMTLQGTAMTVLRHIADPQATAALIDILRTGEATMRQRAADALGNRRGNPAVIDALVGALAHDQDTFVRRESAVALGRLDPDASERAIPALAQAIRVFDKRYVPPVVKALGNMGPAAAPVLLQLLQDGAGEHDSLIMALGATRDARAVEPLLSCLHGVRGQAGVNTSPPVIALGGMGRVALPKLLTALYDPDGDVRAGAAAALAGVGADEATDDLINCLRIDPDPRVREAAAQALWMIHDPGRAVDALADALKDQDPGVREEAVTGLGQAGEARVAPNLLPLLHDPSITVRCEAAMALGELGDRRAVSPLLDTVESKYPTDIRVEAIRALVYLCHDASGRAVNMLMHLALNMSEEPRLREDAFSALGQFRNPAALPMLLYIAKDPNSRWCGDVVWALGEIGQPQAIVTLVHLLPEHRLHYRVIEALAKMRTDDGGRRAESALTAALHNKDPRVQCLAIRGIARLAGPRAATLLAPLVNADDATVAAAAASSLVLVESNHRVDLLLPALSSPRPASRQAAVRALGRLRDDRVLPLLISALADPDPGTAEAAAGALGALSNGKATPALVAAARNDLHARLCCEALAALRRLPLEAMRTAKPTLLSLTEGPTNPQVRYAAWMALVRLQDPALRAQYVGMEQNPDPTLSIIALAGQAALGDTRANDRILGKMQALFSEQPEDVELNEASWQDIAAMLFFALTCMHDPRVRDTLSTALAHPHPYLRMLAANTYPAVSDGADDAWAFPPLQTALDDDPDADVRASAARALVALGLPSPADARMEALFAALNDRDPDVCSAAALSLAQLCGESHGLSEDAWRDWWGQHRKK